MLYNHIKLLPLALFSLLLAACGGGGGDDSATSDTPLPKPIVEASVLSPDLAHGYFEIEN